MPNFTALNAHAFENIAWESRKSSDGPSRVDRSIYRLMAGKAVTVRFLTDPGKMSFEESLCVMHTEDNTWVKYREARAFDGYKGDRDASHKFIPVIDYEVTHTGARRDRKDPLQEQIRPSDADIKNKRPYASAKDVMLVNVIYESGGLSKNPDYDPNPGQVIVLALSPKQVETLGNEMKTAIKYKPDFTFTDGAWELMWHDTGKGGPAGWELNIMQVDAPPLDTLPDPIDSLAILREIRAIAEFEVFGTGADTTDDIEEAMNQFASEDVADDDEPVPAPKSTVGRSPAYIKGVLRKKGVEVPNRISNEDLFALASEHGIAS